MATGDKLGNMTCPCCGGAWEATEMKGGGTSLKCDRGFVGWAKGPRANSGIVAKLNTSPQAVPQPRPVAAPAGPKGPPAPAKPRQSLLSTLLAGDDE